MSRTAIVTIEFRRGGPIEIIANETGASETVDVGDSEIQRARADIASDLAEFKKELGSRTVPPPGKLDKAIRVLFERTSIVAEALVPDGTDGVERLRVLFTGAYPNWQAPSDEVPLVEVVGFEHGFPFELLPVFDTGDLPKRIHAGNLEAVLRRFLGFVAAVRRIPRGKDGLPQPRPLPMRPKLNVALFQNATLGGAETERSFFARHDGDIDLDGPWPTGAVTIEAAVQAVTDSLFDPEPAAIQHFVCHCTTDAGGAQHRLVLAGDDGKDLPVRLGRLVTGYHERQKGKPPRSEPRSLIFLNACGTAAFHPLHATDFPTFFLKNKHLGFIGTETNVPDTVAALFSEAFYTRLLRKRPIGESVVLARRQLVRDWANPIGLLYALYADPDVRVEPGI
ncbi:MAG: CHAT domain-containing protein [Solirubrobacteraceae bacterium]